MGEVQMGEAVMKRAVKVPEGAEFLSVAQAAQLVQVCRTTVRGWCKKGKLRRYGEGRIWRVRRVELLTLMEKSAGVESETDARVADILKKAGR
jgi:excisionase family DNA binding protein